VTHVSLFSGIGGIDIAAEWAGFETIAQVEKDPCCIQILEKHWPGVHRIKDIRDFPDQDYGAVTLVSGGPPCQPSSTAGKRGGREDDRWLWPEFARIVERLLPAWVLAENPLGILSLENGLAIEEWIARLEAKDYAFLPPLVYPIAALGADHRRYRVFFVAHIDNDGFDRQKKDASKPSGDKQKDGLSERNVVAHLDGIGRRRRRRPEFILPDAEQGSKTIANPESRRREAISISAGPGAERQGTTDAARICQTDADLASARQQEGICQKSREIWNGGWRQESGRRSCLWWDTRSHLLRMVHGVRRRMDGRRIKALGNACSPQQVYPILQAIAEVER